MLVSFDYAPHILHLRQIGYTSAQRVLACLLSAITKKPVSSFYFETACLLAPGDLKTFEELYARLLSGEPLSKILEQREFYGRMFKVTAHTLDPRPDSETLIDAVLETVSLENDPLKILDFGTGTGCLLLTLLAELPGSTGIGVDLSEAAAKVADENKAKLKLEDRCDLVVSHWGEALQGTFDVIISNPPYVAATDTIDEATRNFDPPLALFAKDNGLAAYLALASHVKRLLDPRGFAFFEIGKGQAPAVIHIFETAGFTYQRSFYDLAKIERVLCFKQTQYPKSSNT